MRNLEFECHVERGVADPSRPFAGEVNFYTSVECAAAPSISRQTAATLQCKKGSPDEKLSAAPLYATARSGPAPVNRPERLKQFYLIQYDSQHTEVHRSNRPRRHAGLHCKNGVTIFRCGDFLNWDGIAGRADSPADRCGRCNRSKWKAQVRCAVRGFVRR